MSKLSFDEVPQKQQNSGAGAVLRGIVLIVLGGGLIGLNLALADWNVAVQYACFALGLSLVLFGALGMMT